MWPQQLATALGCDLALFAQAGWTTRQGWWEIIRNPNVWMTLGQAKVVIIALGSMDSMPSPLPTVFREGMRYLRPPWLRRQVRSAYNWLQPRLSPYLPWQALPPRLSVEYLEKCGSPFPQFALMFPLW